jgi:monofunctional biosynthetic peptidoglycan transglycosylase
VDQGRFFYLWDIVKINWLKIRNLFFKIVLLFFVSSLGSVLLYRFAPVPFTPLMVIRSVQSIFSDKFVGIHKDWVPLEDISPSMQKAVLKAEDYRFFEHNGFDPL